MTIDAPTERSLGAQLFAAAWMAVALGFALEVLVAVGAFTLAKGTTLQAFFANAGQKVSWGTLVCVGLACARAFKPKDMGAAAWAGLLGAPLAFVIARSAHKGLAQALGLGVASTAPVLLLLLATIKSIEYGLLGALLARLDERDTATARSYVGTGAGIGLLFGGITLLCLWMFAPAPAGAADWFARSVNEVLFPIGCSLILFVASAAATRLRS